MYIVHTGSMTHDHTCSAPLLPTKNRHDTTDGVTGSIACMHSSSSMAYRPRSLVSEYLLDMDHGTRHTAHALYCRSQIIRPREEKRRTEASCLPSYLPGNHQYRYNPCQSVSISPIPVSCLMSHGWPNDLRCYLRDLRVWDLARS